MRETKMAKVCYGHVIKSLIYAMGATHLYTAFEVEVLSWYKENLVKKHWEAAKGVMLYLISTKELWIFFGSKEAYIHICWSWTTTIQPKVYIALYLQVYMWCNFVDLLIVDMQVSIYHRDQICYSVRGYQGGNLNYLSHGKPRHHTRDLLLNILLLEWYLIVMKFDISCIQKAHQCDLWLHSKGAKGQAHLACQGSHRGKPLQIFSQRLYPSNG